MSIWVTTRCSPIGARSSVQLVFLVEKEVNRCFLWKTNRLMCWWIYVNIPQSNLSPWFRPLYICLAPEICFCFDYVLYSLSYVGSRDLARQLYIVKIKTLSPCRIKINNDFFMRLLKRGDIYIYTYCSILNNIHTYSRMLINIINNLIYIIHAWTEEPSEWSFKTSTWTDEGKFKNASITYWSPDYVQGVH